MGTTNRRLDRLETIWQIDAPIDDAGLSHLEWWSHPILPGEFYQFCAQRAEERFTHTERGGHYGGNSVTDPGWHCGVSIEEREARIRFELDELTRLTALLGSEVGWAAWHDQAAAWPVSNGPLDNDRLTRRLLHAWETADGNRAHPRRPLWRRVWPEWKPGMTLDEHTAFDALLAAEGVERYARVAAEAGRH